MPEVWIWNGTKSRCTESQLISIYAHIVYPLEEKQLYILRRDEIVKEGKYNEVGKSLKGKTKFNKTEKREMKKENILVL